MSYMPCETVKAKMIVYYRYVDETTGILYGLDVNADEQVVKFPEFRLP